MSAKAPLPALTRLRFALLLLIQVREPHKDVYYGWDVYFIMQNISQADKQLRESLFEYVVRANRLDRMKVPVMSALLKLGTAGMTEGTLPRVHIAVVRLGASPDGLVS